jgi:type I restriction enzyme S subunit
MIPLGEIADVKLGKMLDRTKHKTGRNLPYLRNINVRWGHVDTSDVSEMFFKNKEEEERFSVRKGDVLVCEGGEPGRAAVWTREESDLKFQKAIHRVRFIEPYEPKLLVYFLELAAGRGELEKRFTGSTIKHFTRQAFVQLPVPNPPLPEQRRIVERIEELFSRLDAGVTALRHAKAQLQRYRQSVLSAAVTGELTKCGDFSLLPLASLIEGLGQGWSPKCDLNRAPREDEWAIIKTTAVQSMRYDDSEAKPLPPNLKPRPGIEIQAGDFLMTRKGPRQRAGVTCFVPSTRHRLMICDTVYRFRCLRHLVQPKYLELALNSSRIVKEIDKLKSGISESGVSLTHDKIGGVMIPVPALSEQNQIVDEVEARTTAIDHLVAGLDRQITRSNRLRQSALASAFSGKL